MIKKLTIYISLLYLCINCSSPDNNKKISNNIQSPEEIYISAKKNFDNQNFVLAKEQFNELKKLYPLSKETIQAEIMIGFTNFVQMEYDDSIVQFDKIINKYPSHKNLDYVYYMKAMCYYEQITHEGLDGNYNDLSLRAFNQVINRFPNSQYAKDSRQKIILVKSNQAAKHMDIGRFYLKEKKYLAALNRFKIVTENFSMTKFTPEALHRMVETYYGMGLIEESFNTASTLGYNYPSSKWYKYSYNLLKQNNENKNFFDKLKNIF